MNLMLYDNHGAWENETGFLAPMRVSKGEKNPEDVLETTTQNWIDGGCAPNKLIFGEHALFVRVAICYLIFT